MKEADTRVNPTQASMKPSQYFINYSNDFGIAIFGQVLDTGHLGADPEEKSYIDQVYSEPHMKFYKPTKCYSVACPDGEIGDTHLSSVSALIDESSFQYYQQNGWIKVPSTSKR
jgi:hypothetical protein